MAIGNGLVDPYLQYPKYATFAKENNLVGDLEYDALVAAFDTCDALIWTGIWPVSLAACNLAMEVILGNPLAPRFNVYDIREKCNDPPLCYDMSPADNLLQTAAVEDVLGVKGRSWVECKKSVHMVLLGDWMLDMS